MTKQKTIDQSDMDLFEFEKELKSLFEKSARKVSAGYGAEASAQLADSAANLAQAIISVRQQIMLESGELSPKQKLTPAKLGNKQ